MDEWILSWLSRAAGPLVGQAPRLATELLSHAVASSQAGSAQHHYLSGRLADALCRVGDFAEAEQVAYRALLHDVEPDVLVDLHWTLTQGSMRAGRAAESLATLNRAAAAPGISARHRARLLVLAARAHGNSGEAGEAARVAAAALAAASEAGDSWAMGWALHVLVIVTSVQGQPADALALLDRALAVTRTDPALTDLGLLLQVSKAVVLGILDRCDEALATARQARQLAGEAGTAIRLARAHSALARLLFETGRWDEAMAEAQALPEDLKEAAAACGDLSIAAVICFHRGETAAARRHLAAAARHAERTGSRVIAPLALARSLDAEHDGARPTALAALTAGLGGSTEETGELENLLADADLLADAVRLATETGSLDTAKALAGRAAALAAGSQIPHRRASALYCHGLVDHDPAQLLRAAERYGDAGQPLLSAQALEAAAREFAVTDNRDQARAAFTRALDLYDSLGAAADAVRLQAWLRAHGIRRGPRTRHRRAQTGWDSLTQAETRIAALVEAGLTNPEIAARLFLSRRTVATHVSHILAKLGVHSRIDVAREAALRKPSPNDPCASQ